MYGGRPRRVTLWEFLKLYFRKIFPKKEYKRKEIFDKNGELDVKALLDNHKNKKKKDIDISELFNEQSEGYIHVPYLPMVTLPAIINPPTMDLNGNPPGLKELDTNEEE